MGPSSEALDRGSVSLSFTFLISNLRAINSNNSAPFPKEFKELNKQGLQSSMAFPGGSDSKGSTRNVGGPGSMLGSRRSPGEGNGSPLEYSCLGNSMDIGA